MKLIFAQFIFASLLFVPATLQANEKTDDQAPYHLTDEELDKKLGANPKAESPEQFVWVVYFHRVPGCDTCQLMSKYVCEAVDTRFSGDVKVKVIVLRYRDLADKKNADLIKKLKVKSPALAVMIVKDGKLTKAKLPGKIWSLASDKKKFIDYVAEEIESYKKEIKEERK